MQSAPVAPQQPQLPYAMIPCEEDSFGGPSASWLGRVWGGDGSEFWKVCHSNSSGNGHGRVSCSSLESGSSYEDINIDEVDDNNNSSSSSSHEKRDLGDNETEDTTSGTNRTKNAAAPRTRVLDEDGFIRRAACVCVDETESKVLLVSSKKDPCSWLVPGGGVEMGEDMSTAAMREAWEEAGVQGHITRYLGLFETQHHTGRKRHRTAVYVVEVQKVLTQYPEAHLGRQREWFSLEEALLHLSRHRPLQSAYLQLLLVSRLKVPPT